MLVNFVAWPAAEFSGSMVMAWHGMFILVGLGVQQLASRTWMSVGQWWWYFVAWFVQLTESYRDIYLLLFFFGYLLHGVCVVGWEGEERRGTKNRNLVHGGQHRWGCVCM